MKALVYHGTGQKGWEEAPKPTVSHHFGLDEFEAAYDTFSRAAETGALKVVLTRSA